MHSPGSDASADHVGRAELPHSRPPVRQPSFDLSHHVELPSASWANAHLPRCKMTNVAHAAVRLERSYQLLPTPLGAPRMDMFKQRVPRASSPQTQVMQKAHAACHTLTIQTEARHADDYVEVKKKEFQHAVALAADAHKAPPLGSLDPRSWGVTVLVDSTKTPNPIQLLDAVAFLASAPSPNTPDWPAVKATRMGFFCGDGALEVDKKLSVFAQKTNPKALKNQNRLVLTWIDEDPSDPRGETCCMRSEFVPIEHRPTADAYATHILELIHSMLSEYGAAVSASRLLESYDKATKSECEAYGSLAGAYERAELRCADEFWSLLWRQGRFETSAHIKEHEDFSGLEFTGMHVRIVPRFIKDGQGKFVDTPLNDPSVSDGLLLHLPGCGQECIEFCERMKAIQEKNNNRVFGLAEQETFPDQSIGMHVMYMSLEGVDFGNAVTTYGLTKSPGKAMERPYTTPRLICHIVPVDLENVLQHNFVMPCEKDPRHPTMPPSHQFWKSMERWVKELAIVFGLSSPPEEVVARNERLERALALLETDKAPTEAEQWMTALLGLRLDCPGCTIGEVYNHLPKDEATAALGHFLMTVGSKLGMDASIATAFEHAHRAMVDGDQQIQVQKAEIETLKRKLSSVEEDYSMSEKRLKEAQYEQKKLGRFKVAQDVRELANPSPTSPTPSTAAPEAAPTAASEAPPPPSSRSSPPSPSPRPPRPPTPPPDPPPAPFPRAQCDRLLAQSGRAFGTTMRTHLASKMRTDDLVAIAKTIEAAYKINVNIVDSVLTVDPFKRWMQRNFHGDKVDPAMSMEQKLGSILVAAHPKLNEALLGSELERALPLLLWADKEGMVYVYTVDLDAGGLQLLPPVAIHRTNLVTTPVLTFDETTNSIAPLAKAPSSS